AQAWPAVRDRAPPEAAAGPPSFAAPRRVPRAGATRSAAGRDWTGFPPRHWEAVLPRKAVGRFEPAAPIFEAHLRPLRGTGRLREPGPNKESLRHAQIPPGSR